MSINNIIVNLFFVVFSRLIQSGARYFFIIFDQHFQIYPYLIMSYGKMNTNDEIKPVEVFSGTIWQAELMKSLLANAEIEAYLTGEISGTMTPWINAPGGLGAVKVTVSSLDYEKAKIVVDEYMQNE